MLWGESNHGLIGSGHRLEVLCRRRQEIIIRFHEESEGGGKSNRKRKEEMAVAEKERDER